MSRYEQIQTRLSHHVLTELGAVELTPPAIAWREYVELGPQAIFGWSWPLIGDSGVLVPYCPEIIDEQTSGMTDEELSVYLDMIEWIVDTHVMLSETITDPVLRQHRVDEELYAEHPEALKSWNRLSFEVLDGCNQGGRDG